MFILEIMRDTYNKSSRESCKEHKGQGLGIDGRCHPSGRTARWEGRPRGEYNSKTERSGLALWQAATYNAGIPHGHQFEPKLLHFWSSSLLIHL